MKMSEEVFGGSRGVTDPRQACRVRDPVSKPKYEMLGYKKLCRRGMDHVRQCTRVSSLDTRESVAVGLTLV
ncbi:unnamed protein product [Brassica rapa subsp. trilocularis]